MTDEHTKELARGIHEHLWNVMEYLANDKGCVGLAEALAPIIDRIADEAYNRGLRDSKADHITELKTAVRAIEAICSLLGDESGNITPQLLAAIRARLEQNDD